MADHIVVESKIESRLKAELQKKQDMESLRLKRYLDMPDLTRQIGSPIYEIVQRVISSPAFRDFDVIQVPEIVPTDISFDLFDFPANHPARSRSDTYYIDAQNILRTHTTVMWYYYLQDEGVRRRMKEGQPVGAFCFGKVYRKDELDRKHMNVFHQMDAWHLAPTDEKIVTIDDLKTELAEFAKAIFGPDVKFRFNADTFPYTDQSLEMEIYMNGQWLEVVGSGIVKSTVFEKLGVDSSKWTGWAFGPGIERFAMISMELPDIRLLWSQDDRIKRQLKLGQKFQEVSKYPSIIRDISFIVHKSFVPNDYFDLIRDIGGDLVEEVRLLDKYEDEKKFGLDRVSYTYRVVYRSIDRTLRTEEIDPLQRSLYEQTKTIYNAELR